MVNRVQFKSGAPGEERPEATVRGGIIAGTLNMLRIYVQPRVGKQSVVVGDYPYLPNIGLDRFVLAVQVGAEAAANAVAGVLSKTVAVDAPQIEKCLNLIRRAVEIKMQSAVVNAQGQKTLEVREHGVIAGNIEDYVTGDVPGVVNGHVEERTTDQEPESSGPGLRIVTDELAAEEPEADGPRVVDLDL